jgi:tetratricopeptide (TPR) repeat protein
MATYTDLTKKESSGDPIYLLEIADIYLKAGLREDAFTQYKTLVQHYNSLGMEDKAMKVMALIAKMDPRKIGLERKIIGLKHLMKLKDGEAGITGPEAAAVPEESFDEQRKEACFDLGAELKRVEPEGIRGCKEIEIFEKALGFEEIFKKLKETSGPSLMNPNFNYNMGVACLEVGLIDDAVEQFQIAYEKKQNAFEAAHLLGLCFKEKSMWEEARQAFEKALKEDGSSQGNILAVKYELGLIFKGQGKTEEALELLRHISSLDQRFRNTTYEVKKLTRK